MPSSLYFPREYIDKYQTRTDADAGWHRQWSPGGRNAGNRTGNLRAGSLTVPYSPSAVYCIGRNFAATLDQMDYDRPDEPDFFIKPPAALIGPEQPIRYPQWTDELTYAGELVAIIDQRSRDVPPDVVSEIIRGYTVMNDVDALNQQGWTARKAFDTSGPLGPWIETDLHPQDIEMETVIDGETRKSATTQ